MDITVFDRLLWEHAWKYGDTGQSKHAAALFNGRELIALGHNSKKTHPLQQKYSKNAEAIHLHAEIDVIVRALRYLNVDDLVDTDLYIGRVRWNSRRQFKMWGNSAPCAGCVAAIEAFGIRHVHYTITSPQDAVEYESLER